MTTWHDAADHDDIDHDTLEHAASLALAWMDAGGIIVRVRVEDLAAQGELVACAREWNVTRGRPLEMIECLAERYVIDEERSTPSLTVCQMHGPYVDLRFPGGTHGDIVVDLAKHVTPWSLAEKPQLILEPRGVEA